LKILLFFTFACVALLGATGVYLVAIRLLESIHKITYTNQFTLWMFLAHVVVGVILVIPFLVFGLSHYATARHRKNRLAVKLGLSLFASGIVVGISGLALIQLEGMPQLPTGTLSRSIVYFLHVLVPVGAVALYVLHRRAGPDIQWKWGFAWGGAVAAFVAAIMVLHSTDPRKWYARGSPEGERYFEPSKSRTRTGNFIPAEALMMDSYCLKCHPNAYNDWFHSAHHFSSFNNPPYLFSVRETRKVSLQRDGEVRASRWCAGCHDPVPFFSGQFDNKDFDDVKHPTSQAGITCTVCHAITNINSTIGNGDYTIDEPLHYPFAYSDNPFLQWINNQMVKAKPDFHKKTFLKDFHRSTEFCSTCHKVSIPMALNHYKEFLRGQNHHDTYLLSGVSGHGSRSFYYPPEAKTRCAECHMPLKASLDFGSRDFDGSGERKIHGHQFPAANTGLPFLLSLDPKHQEHADGFRQAMQAHADFLKGTDPNGADKKMRIDLFGLKPGGTIEDKLIAPLRPELPALKPGQTYLVEVVIRTVGMGHPFTQGTVDSNEIWVDFTARSGDRTIGRNGGLDGGEDKGRVDEWAHFVNVLMLDRDGHRINRRNPQDIFTPLYNHQIPPGAGQVVHYSLKIPEDVKAPVELQVKLRYRKFDFEYMALVHEGTDKVPPLPIVDICEDRVVLPVEGVAVNVPDQTSPIKPAWQRWNDYGIGCFLEGGPDGKKNGELRQAEEAFIHLRDGADPAARGAAALNLARVYNAQGQLEQARIALDQARKADPPAPWWTVAWFTGLVNAQNGRLDEAIANFREILDPKNQPHDRKFDFTKDYVVINELGRTLFDRAKQEFDTAQRDRFLRQAIAQFEKTLTIDSEDLDAHYELTQCYSRLAEDVPVAESSAEKLFPAGTTLRQYAKTFTDPKEPADRRYVAGRLLAKEIIKFGDQPADPKKPKMLAIQALIEECSPVFRQQETRELVAVAAFVLGQLHLQAHAVFKTDDNAAARTITLYRRDHPAAGKAAESIVIYPLNRPEAPGLKAANIELGSAKRTGG
jgi:tetratricopeptide (TPR) repeat protein